jgi:hypothetical protein
LLILLRRKITSPALKLSSSLLLPVKSNMAWGEDVYGTPTEVLHPPVSHFTDEKTEAQAGS